MKFASAKLAIDFLFYADCPSHEQALARLKQVLTDTELQADISITEVETEVQAQRLRFPGSPTIRINGKDIDTTPEAFAFDKDRKLVYCGAIDDNYDDPGAVKQHYLRNALDALLAGQKPAITQTPAVGCTIKWK